ncbi:MAG: hypothetical protein AB7E55_08075 [Pigmentiphaga sp.]
MASQNDIARDTSKEESSKDRTRSRDDRAGTDEHRATRFDGNPNPSAADSDLLKPRDDTPFILEKREQKRK